MYYLKKLINMPPVMVMMFLCTYCLTVYTANGTTLSVYACVYHPTLVDSHIDSSFSFELSSHFDKTNMSLNSSTTVSIIPNDHNQFTCTYAGWIRVTNVGILDINAYIKNTVTEGGLLNMEYTSDKSSSNGTITVTEQRTKDTILCLAPNICHTDKLPYLFNIAIGTYPDIYFIYQLI